MSHAVLDPQLLQQPQKQKPPPRRFQPDRDWLRQPGVKLPHRLAFVHQGFLAHFPSLDVQRRHRLLSRVQIAAYNPHLGLLRPEFCALDSTQFTRTVVRPTSLCHQASQVAEICVSAPSGVKTPEENADFMSCLKARPTKLKTFSATCEACATQIHPAFRLTSARQSDIPPEGSRFPPQLLLTGKVKIITLAFAEVEA